MMNEMMTRATWAGEYNLLDSKAIDSSEAADTLRAEEGGYELAVRQNPQEAVDLLQEGSPPIVNNSVTQTWFDASRAHADASTLDGSQSLPVPEHGGFLHGGYDRVQSFRREELNSASGHEYEQNAAESSQGNDQQGVLLTFPEGEADAVTITERDMEGLQPTRFLSNNIIDFYITYLKGSLPSEDRERYYFFNSFFFTKLVGNNSESTDIDQCEVDFHQVRKWTGEVNLFEKDYIFIPVLRSSHWSLIIICHLSSLTGSPDKRKGSPCIFHLDPVDGKHERFEDQVRSYIIQAWMERYQDSSNRDQIILALACRMKYVQAKVPQQNNGYDCGLYLLRYVEVFLQESTSEDFNFASSNWCPHFTSPDFAGEVSAKRTFIQNLIFELSRISEAQAVSRMDVQPKPRPRAWVAHCPRPQFKRLLKPPKGRNKCKKWNEDETSVLLKRMVEGGRLRKGAQGATHWEASSQEIKNKLGTIRSEDQCRLRYDTLLKAYKTIKDFMEKTGKPFSGITEKERRELKLATPLSEEWFKDLDNMYRQRWPDDAQYSQKRVKLSSCVGSGLLNSLSPRNPTPLSPPAPAPVPVPAPAPILTGSSEPDKSPRKQVAIPGFSTLEEDLRSTLLNLVQAISMKGWLTSCFAVCDWKGFCELEVVWQRLAIVQDRKPSEIRRFILRLWELKLVNIEFNKKYGVLSSEELPSLNLSDLRVYKRFLEKVLRKNPDFNTYLQICDDYDSTSFPTAPFSVSLQRIRVLSLHACQKLEDADLSHFPELRCLTIWCCLKLKAITGWEVVKELGWLDICFCDSYCDFPSVHCLPSLKEFRFKILNPSTLEDFHVLEFSQCIQLRTLEISDANPSVDSVDLNALRFLEVLKLQKCSGLTTIHGLSGLQFLTELVLDGCEALRRLPELGCLKALTHLDMSDSGVEEISGVQELHLLTRLLLSDCRSLKKLPFLGHLKALADLDICLCDVDEIPGVQDLVSLECLSCTGSRLKWLPNLHHLTRLRTVLVDYTPLTTMDPSSFYYGKECLYFDPKEERMAFDDDISDISDAE